MSTTSKKRRQPPPPPPPHHHDDEGHPSSDDHSNHDHPGNDDQHDNDEPTKRRKRRSSTSTCRSNHRMTWEERLEQLRHYKATHGDLLIPIRFKENPSLGKFVHNTREQYKLYQKPATKSKSGKAKRCSLTAERVRQLEELGFVWSTERSKHQKEDWEARLQQLKDYKAKHGDCLVPHGYPEDPSFAEWVHRQRTTHAHMVKEDAEATNHHRQHNPLIEERMKQLEELGFHFTVHADKWMEHWRELKLYRDIHGHCQVPTHCPQNPKLGRWVHTQRHQRRLQLKGKKSCMTEERVQMLDCLGFSWEVRPHQHHDQHHDHQQRHHDDDPHHRDHHLKDEEEHLVVDPIDHRGDHGGMMMGDPLLVSVVTAEDFHPEAQSSVGGSVSSTELANVAAPDLECTLQAQQDGNEGNQVDYFVRGMTMV